MRRGQPVSECSHGCIQHRPCSKVPPITHPTTPGAWCHCAPLTTCTSHCCPQFLHGLEHLVPSSFHKPLHLLLCTLCHFLNLIPDILAGAVKHVSGLPHFCHYPLCHVCHLLDELKEWVNSFGDVCHICVCHFCHCFIF